MLYYKVVQKTKTKKEDIKHKAGEDRVMSMCNKPRMFFAAIIYFTSTTICFAYGINTHDEFSKKSAVCSVLGETAFMESFGWASIAQDQVQRYLFNRPAVGDIIPAQVGISAQQLIGWGAKFEDEASFTRAFSHFFNPLKDQPLTVAGIEAGETSPDWALEDKSQDADQDNSFFDANVFILNALTEKKETNRKEAWGNFFQSLGMVLHHVQDMAQPQHVRNDQHCDNAFWCKPTNLYNKSVFEEYTKGRSKDLINAIKCDTYPVLDLNKFTNARDFWITNEGSGVGIAEFTNRNFVSAGTNFLYDNLSRRIIPHIVSDHGIFPKPDPQNGGSGININKMDIRHPDLMGPTFEFPGEMWFLGTEVTDNYLPSFTEPNKRTSSFSLWNDKLKRYNVIGGASPNLDGGFVHRTFNLNKFNFEAAYPFLFPRAISYSTGLINYFFRGRVEVKSVQYIAGNSITLTIKNVTSEKNPGNAPFAFNDGAFTLYYDDSEGNRKDLGIPRSISSEFADQDEIELSFSLPAGADLIDTEKPFTLVFDGKIGSTDLPEGEWERGIAAKVFYPYPLMAFNTEGYAFGSPVPNIINPYQSFDLGVSWEKMAPLAFSVNDDTTDDPFNRVKVRNAVFTGEGRELLLYATYIDYDPFPFVNPTYYSAKGVFEIDPTTGDKELTWYGHSTDIGFLLDGHENISDAMSILASLTFTGDLSELSAARVKHPAPEEPKPASRTFQLAKSPSFGEVGSWLESGVFISGGLPELDYLGSDSYAFAAHVEREETGDPGTLEFDSALRRTDDAGASYYDLPRFAVECTHEDDVCIQHLVYLGEDDLGNKRMLGWADRHYSSYNSTIPSSQIPLYLSENGGLSWEQFSTAPISQACSSVGAKRHVKVENIIYTGSHKVKDLTDGMEKDQHVLFLETDCYRIIEDEHGSFEDAEFVDKTYFSTTNSGEHWTQVNAPPGPDSLIIFTGDNGAIPGLYD